LQRYDLSRKSRYSLSRFPSLSHFPGELFLSFAHRSAAPIPYSIPFAHTRCPTLSHMALIALLALSSHFLFDPFHFQANLRHSHLSDRGCIKAPTIIYILNKYFENHKTYEFDIKMNVKKYNIYKYNIYNSYC